MVEAVTKRVPLPLSARTVANWSLMRTAAASPQCTPGAPARRGGEVISSGGRRKQLTDWRTIRRPELTCIVQSLLFILEVFGSQLIHGVAAHARKGWTYQVRLGFGAIKVHPLRCARRLVVQGHAT